ncbi:Leucine-rich repeat-containing protein 1-like [Oopsacas minuta]|uniref:Leucine-rich repeat-containing protein 1-like n=1 Tax=Oopsacas minuta TaxID=111878 RepID=A0AAV7K741_9METZ|nr:Leucine-rich repeat-containing protein 1-like [Oopsacas minuta]
MSVALRLIKCCTHPRVLQSEELDYSHSNLLEIPTDVYLRAKSLVALSLNANAIRNLPYEFFSLTKLSHLDISDNDLEKVSDLIKNFGHLKALDLSKNGKAYCLLLYFSLSLTTNKNTASGIL